MDAHQPIVWQPWARLVDRLPWYRIATGFTTAALITSATLHDPVATWRLGLYATLLSMAFVAGAMQRPHAIVQATAAVVLVSLAIGAAFNPTPGTVTLLTWTSMAVPFAFIKPAIIARAFRYAVPVLAGHALILAIEGWQGIYRPSGLLVNPNHAAAVLALAVIALAHLRRPWYEIVPFLYGMAFTGSRWATAVLLLVIGVLWLRQRGTALPVALVAAALALLPTAGHVANAYRLTQAPAATIAIVEDDLDRRTTLEGHTVSAAPQGVAHIEGLHNIYLRVAHEAGLLAGLMWTALTIAAVALGRGYGRWLALAFALFGLMDYYAWQIGALSVTWWCTLAIALKERP